MAKAINLSKTEDFVCSLDKDDTKTIWKIGAVDSTAISSFLVDGKTVSDMTNLVRFGLKGFENFFDCEGKKIQYETEQVVVHGKVRHVLAESILKQIPIPYVLEVGMRILMLSTSEEKV